MAHSAFAVTDTTLGGVLSLPNLSSIAGYEGASIEVAGEQSLIDLPDLTSFTPTYSGYANLSVTDHGTVVFAVGFATINDVAIVLDGTGNIDTGQFSSITNGTITVEAGNYTSAFPDLSDINGSSLYVYGGGSLTLPGVDSYTNNSGGRYFQAYEPDTPEGETPTVGVLNLPNLTSIGGYYGVQIEAEGSGSDIDLPDLTSFSPTDSGYSALSITEDGTVVLAAGLTSLNGVTVSLDGTGTLNNGTTSSATTQFTAITDGDITVESGNYTAAFPNLANINGSSLRAYGGGSLTLPAVMTYTNNNGYEYFQAAEYAYENYTTDTYYGSGSVGVLSLPALTSISGEDMIVVAGGTGSAIDLPALSTFNATSYGSLSATTSATIDDGDLTTLSGVRVGLDGTGVMAVSQWTSFANGALEIESGDYAPTSSAATVDNNYADLSDIDGSSVFVFGGGSLALPAVTSYTNNSIDYGYLVADEYTDYNSSNASYYGSGTVGLLSLPALATIAGEYVQVLAGGAGSEIELPALTSFIVTAYGYLSATSQAALLISNSAAFVNVDDHNRSHGHADCGGRPDRVVPGRLVQNQHRHGRRPGQRGPRPERAVHPGNVSRRRHRNHPDRVGQPVQSQFVRHFRSTSRIRPKFTP